MQLRPGERPGQALTERVGGKLNAKRALERLAYTFDKAEQGVSHPRSATARGTSPKPGHQLLETRGR